MNLDLTALLKLQEADLRLKNLELRLSLLPKELDAIIARRDKLSAAVTAAQEAVKKEELAIKGDENQILAFQEESRKLQQQSALVKKNNEYQAMLAGIEQNKQKIAGIEERLIGRFDTVETLRQEAEKIKRTNAVELRSARTEFEELLAFGKNCKEEIAKLKESRPKLREGISDERLARYEAILRGKNADAPVVKVENGCCGHCHMKVTLQTMNQLSKGELETCDNCQHLLYLQQER